MRRRLATLLLGLVLGTALWAQPEPAKLRWDPPADDFFAWRVTDLSAPQAPPAKPRSYLGGLGTGEIRIFAFGRNITPGGRATHLGWDRPNGLSFVRYPFFHTIPDKSPKLRWIHVCPQFQLLSTLPDEALPEGGRYTFVFDLATSYRTQLKMTCTRTGTEPLPARGAIPARDGWVVEGNGVFHWALEKDQHASLKNVTLVKNKPFVAKTRLVWDPVLRVVHAGTLEVDVTYHVERVTTSSSFEKEDTDNPYGNPTYKSTGPGEKREQQFDVSHKSHLAFDLVRHDPGNPPGQTMRLSDEFREEVVETTERGLGYLEGMTRKDGRIYDPGYDHHHLGQTALSVYTMLKCGVYTDDKVLKKPLQHLLDHDAKDHDETYTLCLTVLALEEYLNQNELNDKLRKTAPKRKGRKRPRTSRSMVREITGHLESLRDRITGIHKAREGRGFGYLTMESTKYLGRRDNSNTQFIALACAALDRRGIPVPTAIWESILRFTLEDQFADGNGGSTSTRGAWSYGLDWRDTHDLRNPNVNMTLAALASTAFARNALLARDALPRDLASRAGRALEHGVGWLEKNYREWQRMSADHYHGEYYYLYSLERAAALTGAATLDDKNWYRENALILFQLQKHGGMWYYEHGEVVSTCFALLFLNRATRGYGVS